MRLEVFARVKGRQSSQGKAAELLRLSRRQVVLHEVRGEWAGSPADLVH